MTILTLKLIAVITMFIDHFGVTFAPFLGARANLCRAVGRVAFPIFVFMIAQGCKNTRDIRRYAFRLGAFALISELPMDVWHKTVKAFPDNRVFYYDPAYQNVFFTLCLGVCAVWLLTEIQSMNIPAQKAVSTLVVICLAAVASFLKADYGAVGVIAIVLCFLAPNNAVAALVLMAMVTGMYWGFGTYNLMLMSGGLAAAVCVLLYNGKRGTDAFWLKRLFYIFYPAHILFLFISYRIYISRVL